MDDGFTLINEKFKTPCFDQTPGSNSLIKELILIGFKVNMKYQLCVSL